MIATQNRVILFLLLLTGLGAQAQQVSSVNFLGLKKTNEALLPRFLKLEAGTPFDSTAFMEDVQALKNLGYFYKVEDSLSVDSDGNIAIYYILDENYSLLPILLVGSVGEDHFVKVGVRNLNLWGRGASYKLAYQYQDGHSYFINTSIPYILKSNFGVGVDLKDFSSVEPIFIDGERRLYDYKNRSVRLSGFYEFKLFHRLHLQGIAQQETYNMQESVFPSPAFPKRLSFDGFGWRVMHEYADLNYFGSIFEGFKFTNYLQTMYLEGVSTPFYQFVSESSVYHRLSGRDDLAIRLKFGLTSNNLGYFSPFTLDSYLNIRGVGNKIDRGTGQIVVNAEYRYVVKKTKFGCWQIVGFVDSGSWRHPNGSFDDFVQSDNIRVFQGFGGRVYIKKLSDLVLRIDFGYDVSEPKKNGFVFGFGQYF